MGLESEAAESMWGGEKTLDKREFIRLGALRYVTLLRTLMLICSHPWKCEKVAALNK